MSGGEPSSIKQFFRCAARVPVPSSVYGQRTGASFDSWVYDLVLQLVFIYLKERERDASGFVQKVAPRYL